MQVHSDIPLRQFGNKDVRISALGLGGHHLGDAADEVTAMRIVQEAVDGGITFFDNCWEYNLGKSENWLGKGLKGRRDKVFLMTKVCTHGRDASLAMQMLEQSLNRLQTDHLDLWQIHGVAFDNDPDLFIRPDGGAEALMKAKEQGKVRFVGFSGHKHPDIHLKMLNTGFPFDSVQMPLNVFDSQFQSFENHVLPELGRRGIAALGMKPISGDYRTRSVALRHEPAGSYYHHRHRQSRSPAPEPGHCTRFCTHVAAGDAGAAGSGEARGRRWALRAL
jgi:aryl-alcohol dehydrogenase-like predicted oxidoreductase